MALYFSRPPDDTGRRPDEGMRRLVENGGTRNKINQRRPEIGIVTALPVECAAVRALVDDLEAEPSVTGDPNRYHSGRLPSTDPDRSHRVVVALQAQDGTRNAAALCTDMARTFPDLTAVVMCGIAAGVPGRGVVLGDVVSATQGVVDYDHVRTAGGVDRLRRSTEGLSKALLRADREIEVAEHRGGVPWLDLIGRWEPAMPPHFRRPRGGRRAPVLHRGAIGSADRLLRDAVRRDALADAHTIVAIEMEASGIAVGADLHGLHWYVVRGICDYADADKNDDWHAYAAFVAAAYTRVLLAHTPPAGRPAGGRARSRTGELVEALIDIDAMRDDYQRRAVIASLPRELRAAIRDNPVARLHVISIIQACEEFPDGLAALVDTLRLTLGDLPTVDRVEAIVAGRRR